MQQENIPAAGQNFCINRSPPVHNRGVPLLERRFPCDEQSESESKQQPEPEPESEQPESEPEQQSEQEQQPEQESEQPEQQLLRFFWQ